MSGDLRVVHGQFETRPFRFRGRFDEAGDEAVAFGEAAQRVQVVVRDVLRVGARIRRQFFLIQGLQGGQGAGGGQAVQPAHVLLQSGQVVQAGRRVVLLFAGGLEDLEGEVVRVDDPQQGFGVLPLVQAFAGQLPSAHRGDDLPVRSGHVAGNVPVAVHDHRECGRLHAADGEPRVVDEAVGARRVHADEPVGLRADHRRIGEPLVFRLVLHGREGVADGVLLQARDPQASHRLGDSYMRHDPTEDGLALTVGVACVDKHVDVAAAHQSRDDLVLAVRALVPADLPLPVGCRVDGQRVEAPLSPVVVLVFVGRGQVDEVSLRPGDQVVADLHIAVVLFHVPADRLGDGLADRVLLGDDQSHLASRPIISSCRTPMRAVRRPRCRVRRRPSGRARRPPPGRRIRSSPDPSRRRP